MSCWHALGRLWALHTNGLTEWRWDGAQERGVVAEPMQLWGAQPEVLPLAVLYAVTAAVVSPPRPPQSHRRLRQASRLRAYPAPQLTAGATRLIVYR